MQELSVRLAERAYPIYIDSGLLQSPDIWESHCLGNDIYIVTNTTIAALYLPMIVEHTRKNLLGTTILPDGEVYKTVAQWTAIQTDLIAAKATRQTTILALGGGVVGDMAGFAAATYQRGVGFIQFPTTLLAQVDASIGGKTAVNHGHSKNMIGAFYQPLAVCIDLDFLKSLPDRERHSGFAEIIKHALIADNDFFHWLTRHVELLKSNSSSYMGFAIERSCAIKARIVQADEREQGARAFLNFGHTFAHAIESVTEYKRYLHGEAVGIGLLFALRLSESLGYIDGYLHHHVKAWLVALDLPIELDLDINLDEVIHAMQQDKKRDAGLRFVVLKHLGSPELVTIEDETLIRKAMLA